MYWSERFRDGSGVYRKGASVYVSWDKSVTAPRTDEGTIALLRSLASGKNIRESVDASMNVVGPDNVNNSQLGYYPEDQGGEGLRVPFSHVPMLIIFTTLVRSLRDNKMALANWPA